MYEYNSLKVSEIPRKSTFISQYILVLPLIINIHFSSSNGEEEKNRRCNSITEPSSWQNKQLRNQWNGDKTLVTVSGPL